MEWVKVSPETMPPSMIPVFVSTDDGYVTADVRYNDKNGCWEYLCDAMVPAWARIDDNITHWMLYPIPPSEPRTNADEIRSMDDETLALFLKRVKQRTVICTVAGNSDAAENLCSLDWLKQPVKEQENGTD